MTTAGSIDHRTWGVRLVAVRRRLERWARDGWALVVRATDRPRAFVRPVTDVVTVTAWVLLAMLPVLLWGALALHWSELWIGLWFTMGLLAVCALFVLGSHQHDARLDLTHDRVVVGERANGRIMLTNRSVRRSLPMMVELPVGPASAAFDLPSMAAHAEHEDLFAIPTARRAVLTVGPVRTVRADPLVLMRRQQELTDEQLLYVHPRTVRIQGSAAGFVRDLEGQTIRKLTDSDVAFHALRNYVPGDDRRYIHWKSTARTGTLMVRQFEETRRSHLLVVLSTRLDDYASDEEFELAISAAGSLGLQALRDGQDFTVSTSGGRMRLGGTTSLLDGLSGVDYEHQGPRLSELTRRLAAEVQGASVVVFVCGSTVEAAEIRRARRHLPVDVRTIVVRTEPATEATIRRMGDVDVTSIGALDELPTTMHRLVGG